MDGVGVVTVATERQLSTLGIGRDAAVVWQALLRWPDASAADIARDAGLLEAEVCEHLSVLIESSLAAAAHTASGAVALDPSLAIEAKLARSERELAEQQEALAAVRSIIPTAAADYTHGRVQAGDIGFRLITDRSEINAQLTAATECFSADVRSIDSSPAARLLDTARPRDVAALARGVRYRAIYTRDVLNDPGMYAELEYFHDLGQRTRTLTDVPCRILIFDRSLAVAPAVPNDLAAGALFIRVQSVIDAFIFMFEHLWEEATPVFAEPSQQGAPDGRMAKILDLIVLGTTDQSMARNLGVGTRTVRREVSELKSILGVSSRAEIAVAASRKGWL